MLGIKIVNLNGLIDECGEDVAKDYLSHFSCPLNRDVENFLRYKAIDFAKQGWAQTHLVMMSYKKEMVMVGYYGKIPQAALEKMSEIFGCSIDYLLSRTVA